MASDLVVPVVTLQNVRPHPNADKLELCDVLGYQMCVPKGQYKSGDVAAYFPADTLIPDLWSEKFAVKNFLKGPEKNRVGRVRLRGEPSFGLVVPVQDCKWVVGENVAEFFGAQKYVPPIKATAGDATARDEQIDPLIERYTDIQNGRIFTEVFQEGEEVVATEKIHGTNCKVGIVRGVDVFAGSMSVRRKRPVNVESGAPATFDDPVMKSNTYWFPWTVVGVQNLIDFLCSNGSQRKVVTVYGEVFGGSIQSLPYGIPRGKGMGFLAFDISVDGAYLPWDEFVMLCSQFDVPIVPLLYRGPYSMEKMKELADGKSTVSGASNIREGIVVKPVQERVDPKVGRAVLKYIGTEYELAKKEGDDSTDV